MRVGPRVGADVGDGDSSRVGLGLGATVPGEAVGLVVGPVVVGCKVTGETLLGDDVGFEVGLSVGRSVKGCWDVGAGVGPLVIGAVVAGEPVLGLPVSGLDVGLTVGPVVIGREVLGEAVTGEAVGSKV